MNDTIISIKYETLKHRQKKWKCQIIFRRFHSELNITTDYGSTMTECNRLIRQVGTLE